MSCDMPAHMTTADFVDLRDEGENSFQDDLPNAVLAFLEFGRPRSPVSVCGVRRRERRRLRRMR